MIINGKVINPGELRTEITIQTRTETVQEGGFQTHTWANLATVRARWTGAHGSEVWAAQSVQAEAPATVLIRYRTGIDTTCAVLLGSDRYEVISVDNIQQRDEYLELKVRKMESA